MKQLIMTALLGVALTLAACGGDDDDTSPTQPSSNNGGATPTRSSSNSDANGQGTSGGNIDARRAVVTIGEDRYEFDLTDLCLAAFGNLAGAGRSVDGRDIRINIEVPPEDWESSDEEWDPPSIRIDDGENDLDWRAGDEIIGEMVDPGMSQVDSFTIDGKSASGTATFVELFAVMRGEPESVQGTFEFNCN